MSFQPSSRASFTIIAGDFYSFSSFRVLSRFFFFLSRVAARRRRIIAQPGFLPTSGSHTRKRILCYRPRARAEKLVAPAHAHHTDTCSIIIHRYQYLSSIPQERDIARERRRRPDTSTLIVLFVPRGESITFFTLYARRYVVYSWSFEFYAATYS